MYIIHNTYCMKSNEKLEYENEILLVIYIIVKMANISKNEKIHWCQQNSK